MHPLLKNKDKKVRDTVHSKYLVIFLPNRRDICNVSFSGFYSAVPDNAGVVHTWARSWIAESVLQHCVFKRNTFPRQLSYNIHVPTPCLVRWTAVLLLGELMTLLADDGPAAVEGVSQVLYTWTTSYLFIQQQGCPPFKAGLSVVSKKQNSRLKILQHTYIRFFTLIITDWWKY